MHFLLGHVVFASAFTLCLKWVQVRKRDDVLTIGAINYITAAALIAPEFLSLEASVDSMAIATGSAMGACYFVAFFFVIYLIKWVGAASSAVVGSLSILFPIVVSATIWDEVPRTIQWVGIGLAVTALSIVATAKRQRIGSQKQASQTQPGLSTLTIAALVGFFFLAGTSRLSQRAFGHLSIDGQRPVFLISAFGVASVCSVIMLLIRRRKPTRNELLVGLGLGTTNILHTHFLIKSLDRLPGYVVFPFASAGGLILTAVVATLLLNEQNSRQTIFGVSLAALALVLLNL